MSVNNLGFCIVRDALPLSVVQLLQTQFEMVRYLNPAADINRGDGAVPNSFSFYASFPSESLLVTMQSAIEQIVDVPLLMSFSYFRIMYTGAFLPLHRDRPNCEYSATICIEEDVDYPYPIFMKDLSGVVHEVFLSPGDMAVYKGCEVQHWRLPYQGQRHIQTFVHYVDANGPYREFELDKRTGILMPPADVHRTNAEPVSFDVADLPDVNIDRVVHKRESINN